VRYRVIINNIHLYTNTASIKRGIGDNTYVNNAVHIALQNLHKDRSIVTTVKLYNFEKRTEYYYNIQIDRI
jgi:hypothetical protein